MFAFKITTTIISPFFFFSSQFLNLKQSTCLYLILWQKVALPLEFIILCSIRRSRCIRSFLTRIPFPLELLRASRILVWRFFLHITHLVNNKSKGVSHFSLVRLHVAPQWTSTPLKSILPSRHYKSTSPYQMK